MKLKHGVTKPAEVSMGAQEIHLWAEGLVQGHSAPVGTNPNSQGAVRLAFGPMVLTTDQNRLQLAALPEERRKEGVVLEPFLNRQKQLRLFVHFAEGVAPIVNGERSPRLAVLAPRDVFQWTTGIGFRVALFNKPQIGPPPVSVLGKLCPVCRVPFAAGARCVTCQCGVVLHCEADEKEGLQCAQMRRECPVCRRPIVLAEGYAEESCHEE